MIRLLTPCARAGLCTSPAWLILLLSACDLRAPAVADIRLDPPDEKTPLAARLTVSTDEPARVTLQVRNGEREWSVTPSQEFNTAHQLPVLGLEPDASHDIVVTVADAAGNVTAADRLTVTTDPLPENFPPLKVAVSRPEQMEPGVTILAVRRWPDGGQNDDSYGLILAVDEVGRVVWYHRPVRTAGDVHRLRNGNLLYSSDVDGARGTLVEIDMLGNIVQQWYSLSVAKTGFHDGTFVDTETFHHDVLDLPTGNFLALSTEVRSYERYPSSDRDAAAAPVTQDVVGDVLVEFTRDGSIVRRWHLLDLLDPYRIGYGSLDTNFWRRAYGKLMEQPKVVDWAHGNALAFDEQDQMILVSARHQDATVKIDPASGKVAWILAPHEGWKEPWRSLLLQPGGELQWGYHVHGTEVTPHRTLLMFDNGNERATPFAEPLPEDKRFSRAVEFAVDEAARTVHQVWSYGGPGEELFFSGFLGDADWLPQTGNVLITDGARVTRSAGAGASAAPSATGQPPAQAGSKPPPAHNWARIVEVTHTSPAEKVFELLLDDEPPEGWRVYRAERLPSLYP